MLMRETCKRGTDLLVNEVRVLHGVQVCINNVDGMILSFIVQSLALNIKTYYY